MIYTSIIAGMPSMSAITPELLRPLKRTSADAGYDAPDLPYSHRHHSLHWQQDTAGLSLALGLDDESIQSLLTRSILLALKAVGFERADPVALMSFRVNVEEYMAHFLMSVRQSMLSSRRAQAIPQDFLYALSQHHLTLRSLLPHLQPPVPPSLSQLRLTSEPAIENETQNHAQLIAKLLSSSPTRSRSTPQIPFHFPSLPSRHTYKFEEIYTSRETDPKKVRERATEEGRMGEEALRKLVHVHAATPQSSKSGPPYRRPTVQERRRALWEETVNAVVEEESQSTANAKSRLDLNKMDIDQSGSGLRSVTSSLGPPVNADRKYWRKGAALRTRTDAQRGPRGGTNKTRIDER